jgi:hypothetical protein
MPGGNNLKPVAEKPAAQPKPPAPVAPTPDDTSKKLIGGWESNCVKETYSGDFVRKPGYDSYRIYMIITSDGTLAEQRYRFQGDACKSYTDSFIDASSVWTFAIEDKKGSNNSWMAYFTSLDFEEFAEPLVEEIHLSPNGTLTFQGSSYSYTRDPLDM